jgi:hypothetical protein
MTVNAGPLLEKGRILEEESSQPERAGRGVLYFITREAEVEGRSNERDRKVVESRKGVKEGTVGTPLILDRRWHCTRWRSSG